jgi:soluble lytic murein transglycosylase
VAAPPADLAATKQTIELARQRRPSEATALATSIGDPVARKLVEWALLRHPDSEAGFERYAAFIGANPEWPSIPLLHRLAEASLGSGATPPRCIASSAENERGGPACARARAPRRRRPRRR